ncbi:o-succinylbenzoate synthase [Lentimicrobium sp. L6]|uniref:o-succinylbenzoate synthase n=1 Tax=Lentimicrobium sp. L6 TaxID=2735916 RepID=UPI001551FB69|nr:o-succinylbenzoate synthase [Lentimicrobium sp. L6]NPD85613.1 o-succinylbenzoate synthase [Lentimicrobium sp. L6]
MKVKIEKYPLIFKNPAGTSRGVLRTKNTWFVKVFEEANPNHYGLGEINMFEGLSSDDYSGFHDIITDTQGDTSCYLNDIHGSLLDFPSIRFGLEMALKDFSQSQDRILFPSDFTQGKMGIPINGLIWMGTEEAMKSQIRTKLDSGFRCLKLKIGAIDFQQELEILKSIRKEFNEKDLELRVDANGAFSADNALKKLHLLSQLKLHSIEQPIKQGQLKEMKSLCEKTPLAIALDEELIGVNHLAQKKELIEFIQPQYIILKPALIGGFKSSKEWINEAEHHNIGWWITSALESNVGLNAIAQWTYSLKTNNYQGLGTGQLFTNNISSPLEIDGERLFYRDNENWEEPNFSSFRQKGLKK